MLELNGRLEHTRDHRSLERLGVGGVSQRLKQAEMLKCSGDITGAGF